MNAFPPRAEACHLLPHSRGPPNSKTFCRRTKKGTPGRTYLIESFVLSVFPWKVGHSAKPPVLNTPLRVPATGIDQSSRLPGVGQLYFLTMSILSDVDEYRQLLLQRAEVRKREIEIAVEIDVLEKRIQLTAALSQSGPSEELSESESFIARNRDQLEPGDFALLEDEWVGTRDAADYLGVSTTTVKRMAKAGEIETKQANKQNRYKTTSLVARMIDGKTEKRN